MTDQPCSQPAETPDTPDVTTSTPSIRWWIAGLIIAAGVIATIAGRIRAGDDLSKQSLATVIPWMLVTVLLLLWWVLLSGARWGTRFKGVALMIVALVMFVVLFRWEGQAGNFTPKFGFRFSPLPEDRAVEYFESVSAADNTETDDIFAVTPDDWPRFGGAAEDQIVRNVAIRRDWDENPPQALWRHPIGPGWSSFSIVGHRVFTQEQRGEEEAVVCYHVDTGDQLWIHTDQARFSDASSGAGPRATPTIHEAKLYALGGTGILNCLDPLTGDLFWSCNIVEDANTPLIEWGMAGSPLIHGDVVIVNPGGETGAVAAYDLETGEQKWAGAGPRATYASPLLATFDDTEQVLIYCSTGLCGHDAGSGELLWSFPWTNMTKLNISQPIVLPDNSVFISSGYGGGSARLNVLQENEDWKVEPQWTRPDRFCLKFNGGVYRDGYVYGLDEGILACFDVEKGKRTWKRGRYNFGQIVMVGDDLLVATESGAVVLVAVTPKSAEEIGSFQAIEGKTWNHPVVNRGRLYIRNGEEVACYDLGL